MRQLLNQAGSRRGRPQITNALKATTIREFDGGWNVVDSDLNLSTRFSKVERNVFRAFDGSKQVRWGTRRFAKLDDQTDIINMYFYQDNVIAVHADGVVTATNAQGLYAILFDDEIASNLPGSPSGWGPTTFASFAQFNNYLLIANGLNKPLLVYPSLQCEYLTDPATGSNANTPIARYVAAGEQYVVMAGLFGRPSVLSFSNTDSWGTFLGDPGPNNAVELDMKTFISSSDPTIKSLTFFRGQLIVGFEEQTALLAVGILDGSNNHTVQVVDIIDQHGAVSHRAVQPLENDIFYANTFGVPSLNRAVYTEQIRPAQASVLIAPNLQRRMQNLSIETLEDRVFSVFNPREGQYMLFVPNSNGVNITETIGYIYSYIPELKIKAWAEFRDWNWRSACRTTLGNVLFSKDNEIYLYGNDSYPIYSDHELGEEAWSDDTVFTDRTGFKYTLNDSNSQGGKRIRFDWTLPWADFDQRTRLKNLKHIQIDSSGSSQFSLDVFVDNFYVDRDWTGDTWNDDTLFSDGYGFANDDYPQLVPVRTIDFVAGDYPQYGLQPYGNSFYGGGRLSNEERLYHLELRGKLFKFRIRGETRLPGRFVSLAMNWQLGSIRR